MISLLSNWPFFLSAHQTYARIWRQATIRLSNATPIENAHRHRNALVKSVVSKLLSDKTFQCLLTSSPWLLLVNFKPMRLWVLMATGCSLGCRIKRFIGLPAPEKSSQPVLALIAISTLNKTLNQPPRLSPTQVHHCRDTKMDLNC